MKRILSFIACVAIVLVGGVSIAGCGQTMQVYPAGEVSFEGSQIKYSNASNFTLTHLGDGKFEANGDASTMTAEQADEFWRGTAHEGDKYVVITVNTGAQSTVKYGAVATEDEKLGQVNNPVVKEITTDENETTVDFILRLENSQKPFWRVEVTEKDAETATSYVVDFTKLYE